MGSDGITWRTYNAYRVSIRAPAWGATTGKGQFLASTWFQFALPRGERQKFSVEPAVEQVSIRAPAWGATSIHHSCVRRLRFQFALPRGERRTALRLIEAVEAVSIRAPAWGATLRAQ